MTNEIIREIEELKKEKNAIILAHNYQPKEIQEIADFVGDSLELCIKANNVDEADIIVFCGVNFMAETASIISPDKKVLLPDNRANCQMADMVSLDELKKAKAEHPDCEVVLYVNSRAETKSEADIVCTSANAGKIVSSLKSDNFIFAPDHNLGIYSAKQSGKNPIIVPEDGHCYVHTMFKPEDIKKAREDYPNAKIVVHPECNDDVRQLADYVESTGGMVRLAKDPEIKQLVVGTEIDLATRLTRENPGKEFIPLRRDAFCLTMKIITLEKVLEALKEEKYEVVVDKEIAAKARVGIQKMLDLS
ncbi:MULTISPECIES: quinolinate synthase NadA [Methanosphaera]|jgi:quinolinate synthase|uniref:Quinolinate synthase n=1 Tax=Methanosphaera stadtmanae TaxID=2317 RepID=A0A328PZD3_9EURY|nr:MULTISPECIES: quinolinate synthase NadA [Methanosphaera]MDO5822332.1 quinolinate synthase NadA [Methanosphaera sp.]MEE0490037.1 quinolinate synthase NadA [Methanosphaera stadtmanae]RAP03322.1 quinolinate synthase [Methanosphaera stadtmanae]RAP47830.1 MAG: quinolinate synthase [Methanosphaera sp. DEW79]